MVVLRKEAELRSQGCVAENLIHRRRDMCALLQKCVVSVGQGYLTAELNRQVQKRPERKGTSSRRGTQEMRLWRV